LLLVTCFSFCAKLPGGITPPQSFVFCFDICFTYEKRPPFYGMKWCYSFSLLTVYQSKCHRHNVTHLTSSNGLPSMLHQEILFSLQLF
jgi:hypothetical protein